MKCYKYQNSLETAFYFQLPSSLLGLLFFVSTYLFGHMRFQLLCAGSLVLLMTCRIFQLWHVGSRSWTRDKTWAPCIGNIGCQSLDHQGRLILTSLYSFILDDGLPQWSRGKEFACDTEDSGDVGLIPGSGRFPRGEHGNLLKYSCPENPMERGAWRAAIHWVTKSQTHPKRLSRHAG